MPGKSDMTIINIFLMGNDVLQVKVLFYKSSNHLLFPISTAIINDGTDKRETSLLHHEAIHGIGDIGRLVVGHTTDTNHIATFFFHS